MDSTKEPQFKLLEESHDFYLYANRLKEGFPQSATIHNLMLMSSRGHNIDFAYQVYVLESHPDSHVVVWMKQGRHVGLYCQVKEADLLIKALTTAKFLSFPGEIEKFFHIPDHLMKHVPKYLEGCCPGGIFKRPHHIFTYQLSQDYPLKCPIGMKLCQLGRAGVQRLLDTSAYYKAESIDKMCNFTKMVPAFGIYLEPTSITETIVDLEAIEYADPDEVPVAWISTYPYGPIGFLMTSENYGRRGLGRLLTEVLARIQVASGYLPHAHVLPDNLPSIGMFKKLPGWELTHDQATWIDVLPTDNKQERTSCCSKKQCC